MNRTLNIYQTLNEREKYILDKLEIVENDLKPENINSVISIMKNMTERISELPLTREQVISSIEDFEKFNDIYFNGIECIMRDEDYPDIKINVYKSLSEETKNTLKIFDINVEDREMTAKEYSEILHILINKWLLKFGTGIKKQECIDLTIKIIFLSIVNMFKNEK